MKYLIVLLIGLLPGVVLAEADPEQRPIPTRIVEPVVPVEYRGHGIEGQVIAVFVIDEEGRVRDIEIELSTDARYEEAVKNALRHWRFEPARQPNGEPRAVRARIPVQFVG